MTERIPRQAEVNRELFELSKSVSLLVNKEKIFSSTLDEYDQKLEQLRSGIIAESSEVEAVESELDVLKRELWDLYIIFKSDMKIFNEQYQGSFTELAKSLGVPDDSIKSVHVLASLEPNQFKSYFVKPY